MDRQNGVVAPPDGRRLEYMAVGGVVNYDMAEYNAAIKFKANATVFSQNGVVAKLFVISFAKKFFSPAQICTSQFWQASLAPHAVIA
jgi:hypothetical protein